MVWKVNARIGRDLRRSALQMDKKLKLYDRSVWKGTKYELKLKSYKI